MNPKLLLLSLLLVVMWAAEASTSAADAATRLLVKWREGPNSPAAAAGNEQVGSTVKRNFNALGWQLIELPPGMTSLDGIEAYQRLGTVIAVEPDRTLR